jgi:monoamine oxidase
MAADRAPADRAPGAQPVPPFHVRQLTIEDGLTLAASPQPGAWQVYDALEPFPPDDGYWAVADSRDSLLGFCCLGEPARAPGETGHAAVLDIAIGIRSDLSGQGWGAELGRAAVAYARSVALDRRLRTTVPDWNTVGLHVAEQSGFVRSGTTWIGGRQYVILEQPAARLVTEYGLDSASQGSLNIVYLLGFQPKPVSFSIFGTSDERYHITGGNQRLPQATAGLLTTRAPTCTINLNTKMTAIAQNVDGTYTLTFTGPSGTFNQVFDRVILTLPFSVLRGLTFSAAGFSSQKTYAIDNLGYGTNSKLQLQFSSRYWNLSGQPWGIANDGTTYVDTAFQGGWDVTRGQAGATGIMVRYAGGTIGASFTEDDQGSLDTYAKDTLSLLEAFFPGITPYYNGIVTLSAPWRNPDLLGSYACWTVGQYTSIAGLEKLRQAKCHFAGEHCSINFQGFMEGGAEEGARAAQEIQSDYASGIFP